MMEYQPHELSLAFPDMQEAQFKRLAADIKAHGLRHPIVLFDGAILDGRHRYRACIETGVEPRFTEFDGDDPVEFVTSENAARRHMSESQIAFAIAAMKPYEERKARERMAAGGAGGLGKGGAHGQHLPEGAARVNEILAEKAGIGARTVARAIKVRERGSPEVQQAVASGEMSVRQAEKIVDLNPAAQRKIVETPKAHRGAALQEAVNRSDAAKRRDAKKSAPTVEQPATAFVRKFLSGVERVAMVCAEDGAKDGGTIAAKFMAEMDWDAQALVIQLERCEPVFRALAMIQQEKHRKAA